MAKQNQKPAAKAAPATTGSNTPQAQLYTFGPKQANVRVPHNLLCWGNICTLLKAHPKGVTQAQLVQAVTPNNGFAWYAIKNQWLAKVAA